MTAPRETWKRLLALFRRDALDRDFEEELAAHVAMASEEHVRRGLSPEEARRRALIELGGLEAARIRHRDARGLPSLDGLLQDVRYAARTLRRSPGFTLTATLILALGIGINGAAFTVANAVLFKGFPHVSDGDRLIYLSSRGQGPFVSYPDAMDWRSARSLAGLAVVNAARVTMREPSGGQTTLNATQVSANTFSLLGVAPFAGRDFAPGDETPGAAPVAILGYDLWTNRYGQAAEAIGQTLRINGVATLVIGVMPPGFDFPRNQDLWTPLVPTPDMMRRDARRLWFAAARLAADASVAEARDELHAIGAALARAYPDANRGVFPAVHTAREFFAGPQAARRHAAALIAVTLILLIACANLAHLILGRTLSRSREISLRLALGASPARVARQFVCEGLMLAAIGGTFGSIVSLWSVRGYQFLAVQPGWFDRHVDYTVDERTAAYLLIVSIASGLIISTAPILRLPWLAGSGRLQGAGQTPDLRHRRLSALLVASEVALTVALLNAAGVLTRSVFQVESAAIGIDSRDVITTFIEAPAGAKTSATTAAAFYEPIADRIAALPGVIGVAFADRLPGQSAPRRLYASDASNTDQFRVATVVVSPTYFQTLRAPLTAGRPFTDLDGPSTSPVAIVNGRFAREFWPGVNPLGRQLHLREASDAGERLTVVGVASDIVQSDATRQEREALVYRPYRQQGVTGLWLTASTSVPAPALVPALRREVQAALGDVPMFDVATLEQRMDAGSRRGVLFSATFLGLAALALLLSAAGLCSVAAFAVTERTREIGLRLALGASRWGTVRSVMQPALGSWAAGLLPGLAGAVALNRLLAAELVGVSPADPITLAATTSILLAAASIGCLMPIRRAMRVDPLVALRHE